MLLTAEGNSKSFLSTISSSSHAPSTFAKRGVELVSWCVSAQNEHCGCACGYMTRGLGLASKVGVSPPGPQGTRCRGSRRVQLRLPSLCQGRASAWDRRHRDPPKCRMWRWRKGRVPVRIGAQSRALFPSLLPPSPSLLLSPRGVGLPPSTPLSIVR